jgi:hypothetical protein
LDVFEPQLEWIFRHDGIAGSVITVENRPPFRAPTLAQILETVDALTPNGGPGFLVLADERDDYTQAAGGPDGLTVEWREYSGETFRHWVAGTPDAPALADIEIRTNGHVLMVKENEKLSSQQVKEILTAYVKREPRPNNFAWREITDKFLES